MTDKRRRYLVNHRYQLSQAGVILVSHLLVALLMAGLLSWFYLFMLDGSIACNHNRQIPWYLGGAVVIITLATTWWAIRRSHCVVGTVVKIDKTLSSAAQGDFPDRSITFRKKDHFPWLASSINDCVKGLQACREEKNIILTVLLAIQARLKSDQLSSEEAAEALQAAIDEFQKISE
ncbi:MAG: hypothetical protein KAR13_12120 [Desulfobulbaceae bacterium]|nr:hypothetical protein [Desulfobulbaceae bacterium]MCK5544449.1 hypothetical protein [Desulfobulbaceae bacterium]